MRKAIDNYAQGKQREVEAWKGQTIHADSGRFICPECLENVALTKNGHFRHKNKTEQSIECDKRVESTSRTAYERMGLPLYLCKQSEENFYLGIGFAGQDQKTLIDAENNCSYLTISDGAYKENKYNISTDRFFQNGTVIIPVDYKPLNNTYYRVNYSKTTPPKLKLIWTDRTDIWGVGQFYQLSESNSRKIRPLGTIVTDEEYYFTGDTWRFKLYKSFVNISNAGYLSISNSKIPVYKFIVIKNKADDNGYKSLTNLLRNIYKVNLLVGESALKPIWPPCISNDNHIIFEEYVDKAYFSIKTPNEYPVVYRYSGGVYFSETIKDVPPTYSVRLSSIDLPISVDRSFNGDIQFVGRRQINSTKEQYFVDIIDENGRSVVEYPLLKIKGTELRCITNFPARVRITNRNKKDISRTIINSEGCVLSDLNWDDEITIFNHFGKCVFSITLKKHKEDLIESDLRLYNELLKRQNGQVMNITPRVLAMYKTLDGDIKSKLFVKKYIDKGYIPKSVIQLLSKRIRR